MNKIITHLLTKCWNIFFPFFAIVFGFFIALLPIMLTSITNQGNWLFGLLVSIPLAVVIISLANNLTDWLTLWDFSDFKQAMYEKQIKKRKANDNQ